MGRLFEEAVWIKTVYGANKEFLASRELRLLMLAEAALGSYSNGKRTVLCGYCDSRAARDNRADRRDQRNKEEVRDAGS